MQAPDYSAIDAALSIAQKPVNHPGIPSVPVGKLDGPKPSKHPSPKHDTKGIDFHGGLIDAAGHGRTDNIPLNVPSGSFVLPADIVSALGQGNTTAGAKAIQEIVQDAPYHADAGAYGSKEMPITRGSGPPGAGSHGIPPAPEPYPNAGTSTGMMHPPHYAKGGGVDPETTQAAGVMIVAEGSPPRVLFIKRAAKGDHHGDWCFPGGHIERSETPEEAALRETHEEIGVALPAVIPWTHRIADGVNFLTFCGIVSKLFKPKLNGEHTDWRWTTPQAPPKPLHPGCDVALRKLLGNGPGNNARVPIIAAGGEYVIPPDAVRWLGDGDIDRGHRWLDHFVVATRKHLRHTLSKLKPPKRD